MKILAIIPLRRNSKRIKNKNFIRVGGKRLFEYAMDEACKSKLINKIILATDAKNIKISKNKKVNIFYRSKKSATEFASTEIVIEEVLKKYICDLVVLIQATNLFLNSTDLDQAIKKIIIQKKDTSLLSVVSSKFFIWQSKINSEKIFSKNYNYKKRPRSQDIKNKEYIENGSFYIFYRKNFLKFKNRLHGKIIFYKMPKISLIEIDDKDDLNIVRKLKLK